MRTVENFMQDMRTLFKNNRLVSVEELQIALTIVREAYAAGFSAGVEQGRRLAREDRLAEIVDRWQRGVQATATIPDSHDLIATLETEGFEIVRKAD